MPSRAAAFGLPYSHRPAKHLDRSGDGTAEPNDRARQLRASRAHKTGQADDLALAHREGDIRHLSRNRQVPDCKGRLPDFPRVRFVGRETAPDHSGDEPILIDVRDLRGPGHAAVPKHRHLVCDAEDFLEVVRNEDDSEPLRAQAFDRGEQDVDAGSHRARRSARRERECAHQPRIALAISTICC